MPWRDKDRRFVEAAVRHGLVDPAVVGQRLQETDVDPALREAVEGRLARLRAAPE